VRVEVDDVGMPVRVDLASGPAGPRKVRTPQEGRWVAVLDVAEVWRVGEEWWRERAIRRTYFTVVVEEGRSVTVFRDELAVLGDGGGWFEQRY
jgi:hypothetical protein